MIEHWPVDGSSDAPPTQHARARDTEAEHE